MDSYTIDVASVLDGPGNAQTYSGTLDITGYNVGGQEYGLRERPAFDVSVSNVGNELVLSGTIHASVKGECSRCLSPFDFELAGEVEGSFFPAARLKEEELDEDAGPISEDMTIDIHPALLAALVFETPFVSLCSEDCKGICQSCGRDLNTDPCDCAKPVDHTNPFSVLADLDIPED